jgi:hypothetical protein
MPFTRVEKETGTCEKVDKRDKGHLRGGWFMDWLSGILFKKVNKEEGECERVEK